MLKGKNNLIKFNGQSGNDKNEGYEGAIVLI